ncbi:MAG: 50S ribosomal protein L35 [bacterium]|nr:50S ribosomal protein L35 [bacterium]
MPKLKTKSGAKKRFRITSSGKIKRKKANLSHILTKKKTSRKRKLRKAILISQMDKKRIRKMIPYT